MRFIHTGDWHIGKTIAPQRYGGDFARQRRRELLETAESIVRFANENQVDLVLCAGDLFHDGHVRMEELRDLNAILSGLKQAKFVVAAGNHDPLLPDNNYERLDWCPQVRIAEAGCSSMVFPELDCCIHSYGWTRMEESVPILGHWLPQKQAKYDILLLHADVLTTPTKYLPVTPNWLRALPMDYLALGHIHQAVVQDQLIRYCGSPEPHNISETGDHGFWLCDLDESGLRVQKIITAQRKCVRKRMEISATDAVWELRMAIRSMAQAEGIKNLYDIELCGQHSAENPLDVENLRQELLSDGVLCQLKDSTVPDYDLQRLRQENANNLLGGFIRSFEGRALSEQEQLALDIGLEALLQEMRKQQ